MSLEKADDLTAGLVLGLRGAYGIHEGKPILFVQAPCSVGLAGEHTGNEGGHGIVAAVDSYVSGVFQANNSEIVRISGEGFEPMGVFLEDLSARSAEMGKLVAVVRGLAAQMKSLGAAPVGFDAYLRTEAPLDESLNFMAAFEIVCAQAMNMLWTQGAQLPARLASMANLSEIKWFGALGGSIGQIACAVGGIQYVSSAGSASTKVVTIDADFGYAGYEIYHVHVVPDSAEISNDNIVVAEKIRAVADDLRARHLGELSVEDVVGHISALRRDVGDYAVLCALQYFYEESLVKARAEALMSSDIKLFCHVTRHSAASLAMLFQDSGTSSTNSKATQSLMVGLALGTSLLSEQGACRIYNMGRGGSLQAFVPKDLHGSFVEAMDGAFGATKTGLCMIESKGIDSWWL